jgi:hypothetical protein
MVRWTCFSSTACRNREVTRAPLCRQYLRLATPDLRGVALPMPGRERQAKRGGYNLLADERNQIDGMIGQDVLSKFRLLRTGYRRGGGLLGIL